jgi:hypothetical protein
MLLFIIKYSAFIASKAGIGKDYLPKDNAGILGIKVGPENQETRGHRPDEGRVKGGRF